MQTIEKFAEKYRLKMRRDEDGTLIIPGRLGHIYEYDEDGGLLGVCLMFPGPGQGPSRAYGNARRRLLALGLSNVQNGDYEGCLAFDPNENPLGAKQAFREAKIKPRRLLSSAQQEVLKRAQEAGAKHPDFRAKAKMG